MNTLTKNQTTYTLTCSGCGLPVRETKPTFSRCPNCGPVPISVTYAGKKSKDAIELHTPSMWRYRAFLPLGPDETAISLGEGWTPILPLEKTASRYGLQQLLMKDESFNPTGSFKARGLSMAVTKAKTAGYSTCIIPTAGNAGGAMSAYCAKAGIAAIVVMPSHTPKVFQQECRLFGAEVILVDGLISDCAKRVAAIKSKRDCFDLSTMKEPFRLEGKKTLGYEIAEQYDWNLPDVILYPTGGGTGLIGIWKAFQEMQAAGWLGPRLPRMIAVQAEACQPLVQTFLGHQKNASLYKGSATIANGLAVPHPFAERWMLEVLHQSNGTAVTVSEATIIEAWKKFTATEGLLIAPEGAALVAALDGLLQTNTINRAENILLLNTGSGYKYLENLEGNL